MGLVGEWDANGVWMLGSGGYLQLHQHLLGRELLLRKKRLQPHPLAATSLRPAAGGELPSHVERWWWWGVVGG